ncbi:DUF2513 domain-containing protein [Faecalibaculum rodentium]|uniref:DUF2513 domain-containing protein n=1 Tax=Faecalibaculum rodentium TaxID=1702221 RepID=UPI0025998ED5|nr:DUF2513 domain-containing protein [Faecalibaculum rodentium]
MELNHDLVREMLLYIEREFAFNDLRMASSIQISGYDRGAILYTARQLLDAGFIKGKAYGYDNIPDTSISSLTWIGHEYLDNIREPEVWSKSKSIANRVGSVSLKYMSDIASQVVASLIAKAIAG